MRRSRYGGYRGRRTGRDFLKYMIAALVVLIAVLAGILYLGREKAPVEPAPPEQVEPQTPEQTQSDPEPAPQPEPEPEPEPEYMAAVEVSIEQMLDGSWKSYLEQQGANALVVNMKPDEGVLNWDPWAPHGDTGVKEALRAMKDAGYHTVARMSCFRDEELANTYGYCIHSNSGYRWKDFGGIHWVSPAHREVQGRLIELAVDLAALGFDEILLDNCGYPPKGSGEMGWIKKGEVYDIENLDTVLCAFLSEMRQSLRSYGTVVSVRADAWAVQEGESALTGLTGQVLEVYADRIWMSEMDTDAPLAEILSDAGVSEVGERLVTQTSALLSDASWAQAVLNF